jgi:hypothetical protein
MKYSKEQKLQALQTICTFLKGKQTTVRTSTSGTTVAMELVETDLPVLRAKSMLRSKKFSVLRQERGESHVMFYKEFGD